MADTPAKQELLPAGGGHAMIFGPDGAALCDYLEEDAQGLLYADVDFGAITIAKSFADPAGHYSRPDVTRLLLNTSPVAPVEYLNAPSDGEDDMQDPDNDADTSAISGLVMVK